MAARFTQRILGPLFLAPLLLVAAAGSGALAEESYSDAKLEAFAVAAVELQRLSSAWQQKIAEAKNEEQASQMRDEAGQELVAAIEETDGITLEEYSKITETARQDPDLASRIRGFLVQRQQQQ